MATTRNEVAKSLDAFDTLIEQAKRGNVPTASAGLERWCNRLWENATFLLDVARRKNCEGAARCFGEVLDALRTLREFLTVNAKGN